MKQLERMNPIAAALYYICVLTVTMFSMNPLLLGISLLTSLAVCVSDGAATYRSHIFSAVIFVAAAVLNPIIVHNGVTVLFYLNDRPFTLEAIVYGLSAAMMIVSALYRLRSMSKTMTSDKIMYIFGRFSPKLALLLSMSLRYAELFRQRWRIIQDAQRALGFYDDGNLIDAARGRARVLSILITWTLENGIVTAESMEARGYGSGRRSSYAVYSIYAGDVIFMLLCVALTAVTIYGGTRAEAVYYPELYMELFTPWGAAGAAAFLLLGLLPLILRVKEAVRWRLSISRI